MPPPSKREVDRRGIIRELIRSRVIGTQEELRELLAARGHDVTQATLSRDLGRLGARRVQLDEGGTAYELPDAPVAQSPKSELQGFKDLVVSVKENESLVVIHTITGAASTVALAIDRSRVSEALGSIAGDDTIFVAPVKGVSPKALSKRLQAAWKESR